MKRIFTVLAVAALMAAMVVSSAPAFAQANLQTNCGSGNVGTGPGEQCDRSVVTPSGNNNNDFHFKPDEPLEPAPGEGATNFNDTCANNPQFDTCNAVATPSGNVNLVYGSRP